MLIARLSLILLLLASTLCWSQSETDVSKQDQSRESPANDQSAAQWTYLLGHHWMNYKTDELAAGLDRPLGVDRHWQARFVLPIAKK